MKTNTNIKEAQKQEAIDRLCILEGKGLMPQVRRDFENGRTTYSERTVLGRGVNGILYWVEEDPEVAKAIREFEEEYGAIAYHATCETFGFGRVVDIFYVGQETDEWGEDRSDLEDGYAFAYVANLDHPEFSEFGTIAFRAAGGGLVRNA